jgi:hypothetical protein
VPGPGWAREEEEEQEQEEESRTSRPAMKLTKPIAAEASALLWAILSSTYMIGHRQRA